jgi:hypothetical protein
LLDNNQPSSGGFLQETLRGNDPLAKVAGFWTEVAGRQLSSQGMACMAFMLHHVPDIGAQMMGLKKFQTRPSEVLEFTRESSRAQASKEQMEMLSQMRQAGQ